MITVECEHDWRVDPHVVLTSIPPQQRLVCAKCAATSSRFGPGSEQLLAFTDDPKSWPKA